MARRPRKVHEKRDMIEIDDFRIPVKIITEAFRNGTRASVTSKALIIRLPVELTPVQREKQLGEMMSWARKTLKTKPEAFTHFRRVEAASQYEFAIREATYQISVDSHGLRDHKILRSGPRDLEIRLNPEDPRVNGGKIIPRLLAKFFGGVYLPEVSERVHELNTLHFRRPVRAVKMSDTYSRWGSCSHVGNINLATRLLLAPAEILDAVIIHELAHLVEQNHSSRFWAQVERALPNYKEYDEWLRLHGKTLLFEPVAV